jgi:hypothetical protein
MTGGPDQVYLSVLAKEYCGERPFHYSPEYSGIINKENSILLYFILFHNPFYSSSDQPGRHFIYTRTIQSEITALCNLGLFAILAQCTAYVLGFIVVYLTLKKLVGRWRPSHEVQKNDSQLIDEEEVMYYF